MPHFVVLQIEMLNQLFSVPLKNKDYCGTGNIFALVIRSISTCIGIWSESPCVFRTTEYTEWQRPLSGVHSIRIEKLARLVRVGARPPPVTISTITYKVVVYVLLKEQIHSPISTSSPICTLCLEQRKKGGGRLLPILPAVI